MRFFVTGTWANFTALRDAPRMRLRNWSGSFGFFRKQIRRRICRWLSRTKLPESTMLPCLRLQKGRRLFPADALLEKLTSTKN